MGVIPFKMILYMIAAAIIAVIVVLFMALNGSVNPKN